MSNYRLARKWTKGTQSTSLDQVASSCSKLELLLHPAPVLQLLVHSDVGDSTSVCSDLGDERRFVIHSSKAGMQTLEMVSVVLQLLGQSLTLDFLTHQFLLQALYHPLDLLQCLCTKWSLTKHRKPTGTGTDSTMSWIFCLSTKKPVLMITTGPVVAGVVCTSHWLFHCIQG